MTFERTSNPFRTATDVSSQLDSIANIKASDFFKTMFI